MEIEEKEELFGILEDKKDVSVICVSRLIGEDDANIHGNVYVSLQFFGEEVEESFKDVIITYVEKVGSAEKAVDQQRDDLEKAVETQIEMVFKEFKDKGFTVFHGVLRSA
jgi:hypothetical protein